MQSVIERQELETLQIMNKERAKLKVWEDHPVTILGQLSAQWGGEDNHLSLPHTCHGTTRRVVSLAPTCLSSSPADILESTLSTVTDTVGTSGGGVNATQ